MRTRWRGPGSQQVSPNRLTAEQKKKRRLTIKNKSRLMAMFLRDWTELTQRRITIELIRSEEWKRMRQAYVDLFLPLLAGETEVK